MLKRAVHGPLVWHLYHQHHEHWFSSHPDVELTSVEACWKVRKRQIMREISIWLHTVNGAEHALKERNAQEQGTRNKKTSRLVKCRQPRAINCQVAPDYQGIHQEAGCTVGVNVTRYEGGGCVSSESRYQRSEAV